MRSRSLTHLIKLVCSCALVLGLTIGTASPAWAASNDNNVEWYGTGHHPSAAICNDSNFPYRNPVNPRADQSVTIRARSYWQDLTGVAVWYTTYATATEQSQWLSIAAVWEANWWNCSGLDMDIWRADIPVQASRVWYKIAYTDGTDTDWQLASGQTGTGMYDDDGTWIVDSTTLTYAPPPFTAVDDDFSPATTGWNYDHFTSVQSGVSAVVAGGVVDVYSGVYTDNVVITRPLTLRGQDPADSIVLQPAISNPNCSGGSLCAGGSNLILVQADNVTIHDLTLDGDNPNISSGIVRGGVDIDARNGIIENYNAGVFNRLIVYNTTIRNIFLRGLYASSGGDNFDLYDNTVQNVQGDPAASIAIMNFGGAGRIANNTVSQATDAIAANWSRGTLIQYNTVTASGSGVHTDNNGGWGGNADVLEWNTVSSCTADGYGVWVFAPYRDVSVSDNTITGCAVGLALAGRNAPATPVFFYNTVNGQSLANSTGVYVTTDQFGYGSNDVSVTFDHISINNTATGIYLDQSPITRTLNVTLTSNSLSGNTVGLEMVGGNIVFAGNNVDNGTTALTQSNGTLRAYANNFTRYTTAVNRTGGTANLAHNWWGTYSTQPANVSAPDWQARLGGANWGWAEGNGSAALSNALLSGGTGTAVIVEHGRDLGNAPFGNATLDYTSMCSAYYDFFTINGSGTWDVSVPVDNTPECITQTLDPGKIYWIPAPTDYSVECTPNDNTACWDLITTNVITSGQNITVTGLGTAALGGTQFVAGSITGDDPTAVTIIALAATTDRSAAPAGVILISALLAAAGVVLVVRRRH